MRRVKNVLKKIAFKVLEYIFLNKCTLVATVTNKEEVTQINSVKKLLKKLCKIDTKAHLPELF